MRKNLKKITAWLTSTAMLFTLCPSPAAASSHTHNWEYAALDDTISAACNGTDCPVGTGTIQILAPTDSYYDRLIYDGNAKSATLNGSIDGVTDPTITYCCEDGCIDAGTHTASITLDEATAEVEFTIDPCPLGIIGVSISDVTYKENSDDYTLNVTGVDFHIETSLILGTDYTATAELTGENKAGGYSEATVTIDMLNENYKLDNPTYSSANVFICRATPVVTAPVAKEGLTYIGEAQELVLAGNSSGGEMQYRVNKGRWSTDIPTATDVGVYQVDYKVVGGDNYTSVAAESIEVVIVEKEITPYLSGSVTKEYDGTSEVPLRDHNLVIDLAGIVPGDDVTGSADYTYASVDANTNILVQASNITLIGSDATNYKLTATAAEANVGTITPAEAFPLDMPWASSITYGQCLGDSVLNPTESEYATYAWKEIDHIPNAGDNQSFDVLITPKDMNNYDWSSVEGFDASLNAIVTRVYVDVYKVDLPDSAVTAPVANTGLVYNGEPQALIAAGTTTFGTMQYCMTGESEWSTDIPTATEAGTYTVYYKVTDQNYNDYIGSVDNVRIDRKMLVNEDVLLNPSSTTYNGQEQIPELIVKDGDNVLVEDTDYTVGEPIDVNYIDCTNVSYMVHGIGNYTGDFTLNYSITRATPEASDFEFTVPDNLVYDGEVKEAAVTVKDTVIGMGGVTIKYYDAAGERISGAPTNAGTYTVKIDVDNEGQNYAAIQDLTDESWTFTIKLLDIKSCDRGETCPISKFEDAEAVAWYHNGVHYALETGLMVGYKEGLFYPSNCSTRAEIVMILWNLEDRPEAVGSDFEDVAEDAWYKDAVDWAAAQGIVKGYDNRNFGPNDVITREQMVSILYRYAVYKVYDVSAGEDANLSGYSDASEISRWSMDAMQWAVGSGLMSGHINGTIDAKGYAERAQVATLFYHFCEMIEK